MAKEKEATIRFKTGNIDKQTCQHHKTESKEMWTFCFDCSEYVAYWSEPQLNDSRKTHKSKIRDLEKSWDNGFLWGRWAIIISVITIYVVLRFNGIL